MRISVTTIESFRLYLAEDFMSEGALLASIRGEFIRTPQMKMGSAFHSILEDPQSHVLVTGDAYVCDGFTFPGEVIRPCLEVIERGGLFEVKSTRDYMVDGQPVEVVAKADQIVGTRIIENKTRWAGYDPDAYAASCQWRFYCDVFQPSSITYNVFCLGESARDGAIYLRDIERLTLYPYPALHEECSELVSRFVEYVRAKGLERFCLPRAA